MDNNEKDKAFLLVEIRIPIQGRFLALLPCKNVLHSKLILLELTFSLVPGPLLLLTSVALIFLH
jgi:hypothetical protein